MSRDTIDNLEDLAKNLDQRKAVFVDEQGQIHDAQKMGELAQEGDDRPVTQVKPTTWF
jgi:predicted AAA+ superfamily ATPase